MSTRLYNKRSKRVESCLRIYPHYTMVDIDFPEITILIGLDLSVDEEQRRKEVEALISPKDRPYCKIYHTQARRFYCGCRCRKHHVPWWRLLWWRIRNAFDEC